jgi:hypothetical protein
VGLGNYPHVGQAPLGLQGHLEQPAGHLVELVVAALPRQLNPARSGVWR